MVQAEWDEARQAVDFVLKLDRTGLKIRGTCSSGMDPHTGVFLDSRTLKANLSKIRNMVLYDSTGALNEEEITLAHLGRLRFVVSLSSADITVARKGFVPDANSFLSRILR